MVGGSIALGIALLFAAFAFWETHAPEPIWPIALLRDRVVASGNIVSVALGVMMMGFAAFLPAYIQGVMGKSAFVSGTIVTAMSVLLVRR